MDFLLTIPLPVRIVMVAVMAAFVASLLNAAIYEFAYRRRAFSAWQVPPEGFPPRTWADRLPIVGWWRLRREVHPEFPQHWVRPLLVELFFPLGIAWLYWWETAQLGLVLQQGVAEGLRPFQLAPLAGVAHSTFLAHAVLFALMLVATMIDFDELTIPDIITLPGTLLALLLAALLPLSLLPQLGELVAPISPSVALENRQGVPLVGHQGFPLHFYPVHAGSQGEWPAVLAPREATSLIIGLGCYWFWCFAYVRRRWLRGLSLGGRVRHFGLRIWGDWTRAPLREITLLGSLLVASVWWWGEGAWLGLLTSLIGLAAGGGTIWLIRVLASAALGEEAMGFGDVLLMMMIGAFIGWQASIVVFFVAPFFGLGLAVLRLLLQRARQVPYGPFLSMGTVATVVTWDHVWLTTRELFDVPWLVPIVMVVCLVACGVMLSIIHFMKGLLLGPPASSGRGLG